MIAGVVSVLTLVMALWTWWCEPRRWVRITAAAALGLILLQALLGGLTVLTLLPLPLAVTHAAVAQAFFCVMIAMVVFSRAGFGSSVELGQILPDKRPTLRGLATATTAAVYAQVLIGALMRHLGAGLAIPDFPTSYGRLVPPFYSFAVEINFAHRCGALLVAILISWTFFRVIRFYSAVPLLRNGAILLLALLALQIALGAITVWSERAVLPTTAHVAVGAAVLAASLALTIRAYELTARTGLSGIATAPSKLSSLPRRVPA